MEEFSYNPLFIKADLLAKEIYNISKIFPKSELYGMTSQIRRAGLSVVLNMIEGFARQSPKEFKRFLFISFGSLKETKYLLFFAKEQKYISEKEYKKTRLLLEEVAKILWTSIKRINK